MVRKIKYIIFVFIFIGLFFYSPVFATNRNIDVYQIGDNYAEPGTYYNNIYTVPVPDNISDTYIIAYDTFWSGSNNPTIFIVDFPNNYDSFLNITTNALGQWNIGGIAQTYSCSRSDLSNNSFVSTYNFFKYRTDYADAGGDGLSILYSTKDIKVNDVLVFTGATLLPSVMNTEADLCRNFFDGGFLYIFGGDYSRTENLYVEIYNNRLHYANPYYKKSICCNSTNTLDQIFYGHDDLAGTYWYFIDKSFFSDVWKGEDGDSYTIKITSSPFDSNAITFFEKTYVMSEPQSSLSIFDIVDLLNPLSGKFFVYQCVGYLIIPPEGWFNDWIADMNTWLSERFGLIYYAFDIIVDFFTRIGNIQENYNYTISFGDVKLFGTTLIPAFSYSFNSLLDDNTFKTVHDIYLAIMDAVFYLCLVVLIKNVFVDIFGGQYTDNVIKDVQDFAAEQNYKARREKESSFIGFRKGGGK